MSTDDLNDQIAVDPDDEAPQLVMADHLLAIGDPRGELIILEHRDRTMPNGLVDPDALETMLCLAAEYSFPRAHALVEPRLAWIRADNGIRFDLQHRGRDYWLRFEYGSIAIGGARDALGVATVVVLDAADLVFADRARWSDDEAESMVLVLSDAIRLGTPIDSIRFPTMKSPLPSYAGGSRRIYRLPQSFREAYDLPPDRYGLAARDLERFGDRWRRLEALRRAGAQQPEPEVDPAIDES